MLLFDLVGDAGLFLLYVFPYSFMCIESRASFDS